MNVEWINIHLIYIWFTSIIIQIVYMWTWKSHILLGFFVPLENFSLIWRRHYCRRRASKFYLYLTLTHWTVMLLSRQLLQTVRCIRTERFSSWVVTTWDSNKKRDQRPISHIAHLRNSSKQYLSSPHPRMHCAKIGSR